jgi:hypothetical protein
MVVLVVVALSAAASPYIDQHDKHPTQQSTDHQPLWLKPLFVATDQDFLTVCCHELCGPSVLPNAPISVAGEEDFPIVAVRQHLLVIHFHPCLRPDIF